MMTSVIADFRDSLRRYRFWLVFGVSDATNAFRRTYLGGLFLTLNSLLRIAVMYFLFRDSLGSTDPNYFGYVALGLPLFSIYSASVSQGYSILMRNKAIIQNINMPYFAYIFRFMTDILYKFGFSSLVFLTYIAFHLPIVVPTLHYLVLGIILALLMVVSIALFCMVIAAFFPNLFEVLNAGMGIMFFATPVFWHPGDRGGIRGLLATYNPFAHMLAVVREPALGRVPDLISIGVCVAIIVVFGTDAIYLFKISRPWLIYRL